MVRPDLTRNCSRLVESALALLDEMATFEEASVSGALHDADVAEQVTPG